MGVGYRLVNQTKREQVLFSHLPVEKKREICGHGVSAAMVSWYLLSNQGDEIQFVSDTYDDWPFASGTEDESLDYPDRTEALVDELIAAEIVEDWGILWCDEEEPETVFIRDLRNVWLRDVDLPS